MKNLIATCLLAAAAAGCCTCTETKTEPKKMDTPDFVIAKIADCDAYASRHPRLARAFEFLKRPDLAKLAVGRYEIDGSDMWAMVQEANLTPFCETQKAEVHGAYIDIQAPLTGPETIGLVALTPEARAKLAFDAAKDIAFLDAKTAPATLAPGDFCILMPPLGAHAPGCSLDGARTIRKLVIKIRK